VLEKEFEKLYLKFRLNYIKKLFSIGNESLTPTEAYCVEAIFLLNRPTINEFAEYIHISQPNATYRINNLIKKGYVRKIMSKDDRREYHLEVTDEFLKDYGINASFNAKLMEGIREQFSKDEIELLETMIQRINNIIKA